MDDGVAENAATRWLRNSLDAASLMAEPSAGLPHLLAEGFHYEDRRSLPLDGDHRVDGVQRMWESFFEVEGSPTHTIDGVVAQHGERLALIQTSVLYGAGFRTELLSIYQLDGSLTLLERVIVFDRERHAEAVEAFRELRSELG